MAHLSRIGRQGPQPTNLPRSGDRMRHWRNETAGMPMDSVTRACHRCRFRNSQSVMRPRRDDPRCRGQPGCENRGHDIAGATQLPHDSSRKRESCARFPCRRETRRPGVLRRDAAGRHSAASTGCRSDESPIRFPPSPKQCVQCSASDRRDSREAYRGLPPMAGGVVVLASPGYVLQPRSARPRQEWTADPLTGGQT